MSSQPTVLDIEGLTKNYSDKTVVNNISFSIREGEFWGLLGPNGAGKTTTIKLLSGLTRPDSGKIFYYGKDFFKNQKESKKEIGVVPQASNLDRDLTAYENLNLHAILHDIPGKARKSKIMEALEFAGLTDYKNRQVKTFSGGMKRRLVIVRSLLHEPNILFLDEPTIGLDPQIRRSLWDLVININQIRKTAILLTTHYIEEAEKLCQKVKIMNKGEIIADDSPSELKKQVGHFVLETKQDGQLNEEFFATKEEAITKLSNLSGEATIREATLEDVFIKLTGRRINV